MSALSLFLWVCAQEDLLGSGKGSGALALQGLLDPRATATVDTSAAQPAFTFEAGEPDFAAAAARSAATPATADSAATPATADSSTARAPADPQPPQPLPTRTADATSAPASANTTAASGASEPPPPPPPAPPPSSQLAVDLPRSLPVNGLLHVIHNATDGLRRSLPHLDTFSTDLKAVTDLLRRRWSKYRLLQTCFATPAAVEHEEGVRAFKAQVYKGRWGTLAHAVEALAPLEDALRCFWDRRRFNCGRARAPEDEEPDDGEGIEGPRRA